MGPDEYLFVWGDPQRVTICGQSAGAASVYLLLGADNTDGLFHRAIIQSTPLGVPLTQLGLDLGN